MAGNFNKVILLGNLTRDPELRHTSGNQAVANIGLAVNRRWRSPDGEQREETTFVDCEAWGKTAEVMCQYLAKGRPVFIEGRLKLDQWEKEGQKFSKLRVVVENFQFVDSGQGRGGGDSDGGGGRRRHPLLIAHIRAGHFPTRRTAFRRSVRHHRGDSAQSSGDFATQNRS
ncbi:MAG: single-stranded DNA-binding protein [Phycisphaerales bacterium]|nr:single-stranded DNA-binding protein [Phycisphaerales bacterium]